MPNHAGLLLKVIAYRREVASAVTFPEPTHVIDLPPGYEGTRSVALKFLDGEIADYAHRYVHAPKPASSLPPAITAEEALGDLPAIDARKLLKSGALRRGARRFDQPMPYSKEPHTPYSRSTRTAPQLQLVSADPWDRRHGPNKKVASRQVPRSASTSTPCCRAGIRRYAPL